MSKSVYLIRSGHRLGVWVSNEANDPRDRKVITHYVYRDDKTERLEVVSVHIAEAK